MTTLSRRSFLAAAATTAAGGFAPLAAAGSAPRFKPGLVTYNVAKDWDLPTIIKACSQAGIAAVECRTTHRHGVEPTLSPAQRAEVKKLFAGSGVVFLSCGSVCEFHSPDASVVRKNVEECKRFVDLVKDLGGKGVKVRPNGVAKGADAAAQKKTFEQIGRALAECGQAAKDAGVEIWVEVHGGVTQIPQNMRTIMDACGHPSVGVTWNSNPTDLDAKKSVAPAFELLKPFIRCCHINELGNDKAGKYPYRELFTLLKGIGYDRYTLCEVGEAVKPADGVEFLTKYRKQWEELANG